MSENNFEFVTVNTDQRGVSVVEFNRPQLHNAFNEQMIAEMGQAFSQLAEDVTSRLVVLKGKGKSFCAGADLNYMKKMVSYTREENYRDTLGLAQMFEMIDLFPKPVIASVHGAALGGGSGIVACCDYVIADSKTLFGFTEVQLGLIPGVISPFVMAKIGFSQARAYFLSGERFAAKRAQEIGLIHQLSDDLENETNQLIEKMLLPGREAQVQAKRLIRGVRDFSFESDEKVKDFTAQMISNVRVSAEGQEGMMALLEKRRPNWQGDR